MLRADSVTAASDLHGGHNGGYIGCIGALSIGGNCAMAKKSSLIATSGVGAPPVIAQLVEKFAEHRETYRRAGYNETQLRQDFLDPFFAALGWDVFNQQGFAEAYRDVILEQGLKVEQSVRAPDYCFRIGGTSKFFVEAKKPAVDIKSNVETERDNTSTNRMNVSPILYKRFANGYPVV